MIPASTWTESQKRYAKSSKGLEARKKYQSSEKAKEAHKRYLLKRKARLVEEKQVTETTPVENKVKAGKIKKEPTSKK